MLTHRAVTTIVNIKTPMPSCYNSSLVYDRYASKHGHPNLEGCNINVPFISLEPSTPKKDLRRNAWTPKQEINSTLFHLPSFLERVENFYLKWLTRVLSDAGSVHRPCMPPCTIYHVHHTIYTTDFAPSVATKPNRRSYTTLLLLLIIETCTSSPVTDTVPKEARPSTTVRRVHNPQLTVVSGRVFSPSRRHAPLSGSMQLCNGIMHHSTIPYL